MSIVTPEHATAPQREGQAAALTVTQAFNNRSWASQAITSAAFPVGGSPLLVSSSSSGWLTPNGGAVAQEPVQVTSSGHAFAAGTPQVFINPANCHQPLVSSWALVPGVPASPGATVTASTATGTTVDGGDSCCVTVYELGFNAPLAVRAATGPSAAVPGQTEQFFPGGVMLYQPFVSFGGRLLIRVAGSAIPAANLSMTTLVVDLDGAEIARAEICAHQNTATASNWHAATVPVSVLADATPGSHALVVRALGGTSATQFDYHDFVSALVLEEMGPPGALQINPLLVNAPCAPQAGNGVAASAGFSSGGGTLVFWAAASAWTGGADTPVNLNFHLDGLPLTVGAQQANLHGFANTSVTGAVHLTLVSNDLVVEGISPGRHLLELVGDGVTQTDGNDRCSVTVLELGPAS